MKKKAVAKKPRLKKYNDGGKKTKQSYAPGIVLDGKKYTDPVGPLKTRSLKNVDTSVQTPSTLAKRNNYTVSPTAGTEGEKTRKQKVKDAVQKAGYEVRKYFGDGFATTRQDVIGREINKPSEYRNRRGKLVVKKNGGVVKTRKTSKKK